MYVAIFPAVNFPISDIGRRDNHRMRQAIGINDYVPLFLPAS